MSQETNQAAQADPSFIIEGDDHATNSDVSESQQVDSATTTENQDDTTAGDKPVEDGFQKRINKVTADKYEERRRADALQKELDALRSKPEEQAKPPTLEGHDYDQESFDKANISYQVQQEIARQNKAQREIADKAKSNQATADFNERIAALGKRDFAEKASAIPILPNGVADALVQADNGAELIYHLGEHLDQADAIAQMTPATAMMELGRLSAELNKKTEIKPSAAPEPIEPLSSGGSLNKERGPTGATFE